MKIAHVIESIDPRSGGTSSAFLEIIDALAGHTDCQTRAFAHAPDPDQALKHAHARENFELTGPGGQIRVGNLARQTIDALRAGGFDAVHLHGLWNGDLVRIALAANKLGIPTLWQPHGMLVERAYRAKWLKKQIFLLAGLRKCLRQASAMVYCTEGERSASVNTDRWAGGNSGVVPLPIRCPIQPGEVDSLRQQARARFGLDPSTPAIVFLGRIHPVKRLELTLDAISMAQKSTPGLRLLVFGDGDAAYARTLHERAAALGIEELVTWHGWIARDDRWMALAAGDCLTLNSMFENFGYVIGEALMVKTTVAVTDNLAMTRELRDAGAASCSESNASALAGAYHDALSRSDQDRIEAQAWAGRTFSPGAVGGALVDLYQSVLSDR